ncbi:SDR family oxidoreductase [Shewanella yunxiaonensis]|uniref:SDR family oxidoreductase n=1 Tax=Shewanella yunxiaonensis TaxID=2829809 RepID=A0ABX7YYA0_9GAMM|nr:SDR family oxidoreductase [Shewanella yunxiaonensis]QUN07295.1 SDR family oxidoreductase [Shewanella yunxiaonensis]
MKHIAVFGCGWFGLPLAKSLRSEHLKVTGSKTTADGVASLQALGINGVQLALDGDSRLPSSLLQGCDALVVNIPPGLRRGDSDYLTKLMPFAALVRESQLSRLIFISSTGAYQQTEGVLTETDLVPATEGSSAVLQQAEQLFLGLASPSLTVTVLRFAGLVGPGRHPGRFMAGRKGLTGPRQPVNLVHLHDCITATKLVLNADKPGAVYNLSAPFIMDKQTFYCLAAEQLALPLPEFVAEQDAAGKRIDGNLICEELDFTYAYADANALLLACKA